jgi:hypothetical protein
LLVAAVALSAKARDRRLLAWLPLVFATIHVGAGFGVLSETVTGWGERQEERPEWRVGEQMP